MSAGNINSTYLVSQTLVFVPKLMPGSKFKFDVGRYLFELLIEELIVKIGLWLLELILN